MKDKLYTMTYHCSNCGEEFYESFEFGERAIQGKCTHCGVIPLSEEERLYRKFNL